MGARTTLACNGGDPLATLKERSRARRERQAALTEIERVRAPTRNDLLPDVNFAQVPLENLTPAKRRIRKSSAVQCARVKSSIETLGFTVPLLITKDRRIVDGHIRYEVAGELGMPALPCIVVDHLSEAEIRLLSLAANRIGELGEWDMDALRLELGELIIEDAPIEISGFSLPQIDALLLEDDPDPTDDVAPDIAEEAITRPGDRWTIGPHRLICGDARDPETYADLMGEDEARCVLTDPPYNVKIDGNVSNSGHREFAMASGEMSDVEFEAFNQAWMSNAVDSLVDGGLILTFIDWRSLGLILSLYESLAAQALSPCRSQFVQ